MKIITISREFGSGGRELGKRLSDVLGFDYYDKEIITGIAKNTGMDEKYLDQMLDTHGWRNIPMMYHHSFAGMAMPVNQTEIMMEQKNVIEQIAKAGKDCIIVGRNADILLEEYHPFTMFVCADMESKIKRCLERAPEGENHTPKEMERKIHQIDKNRARTREIISDSEWGAASSYNITVNTSGWEIKELVPSVAAFAQCWFEHTQK